MRRDYKDFYKRNSYGFFSKEDVVYEVLFDLINDEPDDKLKSLINYIIYRAEFYTGDDGYYTRDVYAFSNISDDQIVRFCQKYYEYEFWARVFELTKWRDLDDNVIDQKVNFFADVALEKNEKFANDLISIFDYYHNNIEPAYFLKGKSIDDMESQSETNNKNGDLVDILLDKALDYVVDKEKMLEFFIPVFVEDKEYKVEDHATGKIQLSRFDVYFAKLDGLLKDNVASTILGQVAYLTFNSEYLSSKYKNYKRTGKKVAFAPFLREYFDAIGKTVPKDTSPNKYAKDLDDLKIEFKCLSSKIR